MGQGTTEKGENKKAVEENLIRAHLDFNLITPAAIKGSHLLVIKKPQNTSSLPLLPYTPTTGGHMVETVSLHVRLLKNSSQLSV